MHIVFFVTKHTFFLNTMIDLNSLHLQIIVTHATSALCTLVVNVTNWSSLTSMGYFLVQESVNVLISLTVRGLLHDKTTGFYGCILKKWRQIGQSTS